MAEAAPFQNDDVFRDSLAFELVAGLGEAKEAAPEETVGGDDHQGHHDGAEEEDGELAGAGGSVDLGSEADGLEDFSLDGEVLGEDAGVPGTARGGDEAGDEVGEDAGEDDGLPTLDAGEAEEGGDLLEV